MSDLLQRFAHLHAAPRPSRRAVLGAIGLAGGFVALPAAAMTQEQGALPASVPERPGALSWARLATAMRPDGAVRVPKDIAALDGKRVEIDGWMMPVDDEPLQAQFLLLRFNSHCPFCVPGGATSLVEVTSPAGVALIDDRPVSLSGTFRVRADSRSLVIYRLTDARAA